MRKFKRVRSEHLTESMGLRVAANVIDDKSGVILLLIIKPIHELCSLAKPTTVRCSKTESEWRLNQIFEVRQSFDQSGAEIKKITSIVDGLC